MKYLLISLIIVSFNTLAREVQVRQVTIDNYNYLEYEYYLKDNKEIKHGFFKRYHGVKRDLYEQGNYVNNRKVGLWKYSDGHTEEYQDNIHKLNYSGGLIKSYELIYDDNDNPIKQGKYVMQQNGTIKEQGYYKQGRKTGMWYYYGATEEYSNNLIIAKSGGNTSKTEFKYNEIGDIVRHGKHIVLDDDGNITEEGYYEEGRKTDVWKYFTRTKTNELVLDQMVRYKNEGESEGVKIWYWDNGKVKLETQFKDGGFFGPFILYWSNGNKRLEGSFQERSQITDTVREFNEGGSLIEILTPDNPKIRSIFASLGID